MSRAEDALHRDIDRIQKMINDNLEGKSNEYTAGILSQAQARIESELKELGKDPVSVRQKLIDDATDQLIAFENEADVSRKLKATIQDSRTDLINARRSIK